MSGRAARIRSSFSRRLFSVFFINLLVCLTIPSLWILENSQEHQTFKSLYPSTLPFYFSSKSRLSSIITFAEGSGFLRWTRSYDGFVNATSSSTGISAVVGPSEDFERDGTYIVSVLNFSSGEIILQKKIHEAREPIVIRPRETRDGKFTCSRREIMGTDTSEKRSFGRHKASLRSENKLSSSPQIHAGKNLQRDREDDHRDHARGDGDGDEGDASRSYLWCAIFLFSSKSNEDPLLLFPSGIVRSMLNPIFGGELLAETNEEVDIPPYYFQEQTKIKPASRTSLSDEDENKTATVPWNCLGSNGCMFRTQEQQSNSIGGCFRRAEPWPYLPNLFPPLSSHVILVDSDGVVFSFRPLEVALYGLRMVRKVSDAVTSSLWRSPSLGWEASVQYMPVTNARTIFVRSSDVRESGKSRAQHSFHTQSAICLLVFIGSNGAISFYDADREDNTTTTRLPFIGMLRNNFNEETNPIENTQVCYPYAQTIRRILPALESDLIPENPLLKRSYGSVLGINCRDGRGWLWNAIIRELDPASNAPNKPFNITFKPVGEFKTPSSFDITIADMIPGDPMATDIELTTIQPIFTLATVNGHAEETQQGSVLQIVTSIAALRYLPNTYSLESTDANDILPSVALMTFISDLMTEVTTDNSTNMPFLTSKLVGSVSIGQVSVIAGSPLPTPHKVTHSIGWVSSPSGLPARYNATVFGSSFDGQAPRAIQTRAVIAASDWFAHYGIVYSVLCDVVHVLLNATTGAPVSTSKLEANWDLDVDDEGRLRPNVFHGHSSTHLEQGRVAATGENNTSESETSETTTTPTTQPTTSTPIPPKPTISFFLRGGVKQAAPVALDPWMKAMTLTPILDWQDDKSQVNRSVLHNRAVVLSPSVSAPNQPTCVYTQKASHMVVIVNIRAVIAAVHNGTFAQNSAALFSEDGIIAGNWVPLLANQALYNPYTQNFCMASIMAKTSSAIAMVPAGNSVVIVQVSSTSSKVQSRITVNPLRDLIDQTAQVSYALAKNRSWANSSYHPQTLHPVGTPMIYVCGQQRLHAYYGVIGNTTWTTTLIDIPGCERCHCNQDPKAGDASLLLSTDRKFIVLVVDDVLESGETSETILTLHADSGKVLYFATSQTVRQRSSECSTNTETDFGDMREVSLGSAGINGFAFMALVPLVGTRCFAYVIVVSDPTRPDKAPAYGNLYVFFFLGSTPSMSQYFLVSQSIAYMNTLTETQKPWAGHFVYGIDVASCAEAIRTNEPTNTIGVLPIFAANNVIAATALNAMLFTVQVVIGQHDYVYLKLNTYVPSVSPNARWYATLNHVPPSKFDLMQNTSVFTLKSIYVCVASGPLQCYGASADSNPATSYYIDSTVVPHFGEPAIDQFGIMVFSNPPFVPHAIKLVDGVFIPSLEYVWKKLYWPGHDQGVEMNIDQTSCIDPQITNEGLVLVCDLQYNPLNTKNQRHIVIVAATTGMVLLADGPWALPKTVIISDNGIQIVYINNLATAVSIQFVAQQQLTPLKFSGNLCRQEHDAVYALYIDKSTFRAKMTPTNTSKKAVELLFDEPTYAYEWIGFEGLRLGRTYIAAENGLVAKLFAALPSIVTNEGTLHFFVADTLTIMNSDFNINLMDPTMCDMCAIGCPYVCTVELSSGDQYRYDFMPLVYWTTLKPNGTRTFDPKTSQPSVSTFSGSVTLDMVRKISELAPFQEVVRCVNVSTSVDSMTLLAPTNRFCLLSPRLSYKRWAIVQIASGSFASSTLYSAPWNGPGGFSGAEHAMLDRPFLVGGWTAISSMLNKAISNSAFPDDLSGDASQINHITVTTNTFGNESYLNIYPTDVASSIPVVTMSNTSCLEMDRDIRVCLEHVIIYGKDQLDTEMQSVTWRGTSDSNWGDGFIAVNYRTKLSSVMRTPARGKPLHCGDLNTPCPVQCHPSTSCASQINNFFNQIFYAASFLPPESTVPFPLVQMAACADVPPNFNNDGYDKNSFDDDGLSLADKDDFRQMKRKAADALVALGRGGPTLDSSVSFLEASAYASRSNSFNRLEGTEAEAPGDMYVRFACLKSGKVAVITDDSTFIGIDNAVAALFSRGTQVSSGATFDCTECTYFLLRGVVAEPFGWLGGGAVKNLIICILFYWIMEKVKERQRELNENRRRHKRHEKQIRMIDQRLREIAIYERRLERKNKRLLQNKGKTAPAGERQVTGNNKATSGLSNQPQQDTSVTSYAFISTQYLGARSSSPNGGGNCPFTGGTTSYVMLPGKRRPSEMIPDDDEHSSTVPFLRKQSPRLQPTTRPDKEDMLPLRGRSLSPPLTKANVASISHFSQQNLPSREDYHHGPLVLNSEESNSTRPTLSSNTEPPSSGRELIGDGMYVPNTNMAQANGKDNHTEQRKESGSSANSDTATHATTIDIPQAEPLFSPLLRLPRTFNKDVSKISESEREIEKIELRKELDRSRIAISKIREERSAIQKGRWWCSRKLPNPIALYAKLVAAMGRFRRYEDRRLQVNRIKDNFVYKEFSPESLVEMLSAILGETADNRPQVVSFAHFYQWNLCDNRQWVIREHVDEQSQFASPEVLEGMENELLSVQQQLQDVYVAYKVAFKDNLIMDASQPFVLGDEYALSRSAEQTMLEAASSVSGRSSRPQSVKTSQTGRAVTAAGGVHITDRSSEDEDESNDPEEDDSACGSHVDIRASVGHAFYKKKYVRPTATASRVRGFFFPRKSAIRMAQDRDKQFASEVHFNSNDKKRAVKSTKAERNNNNEEYSSASSANEDEDDLGADNTIRSSDGTGSSSLGKPQPNARSTKKRSTRSIRQQRRQRLEKIEEQFRQKTQLQYVENVQREFHRISQQRFSSSTGEALNKNEPAGRSGMSSGRGNLTDSNDRDGRISNPNGTSTLSIKQTIRQAVTENLTRNIKFQGMDAYSQSPGLAQNRRAKSRPARATTAGTSGKVRHSDIGSPPRMPHSQSTLAGGSTGRGGANDDETRFNSNNNWSDNPATEYSPSEQFLNRRAQSRSATSSSSHLRERLLLTASASTSSSKNFVKARLTPGDSVVVNNENTPQGDARADSRSNLSAFGSANQCTDSEYVTEVDEVDEVEEVFDLDEPDPEVERALAQSELYRLVETFNHFHELKPHCFEYASLPSRKIDDKLLPSPILIIFSLLETLITIAIYAWDIFTRTYGGRDGKISAFDLYQCVFFMVFNSSLPSSLVVNVIARADLGKTSHTKNALEKFKDIYTNPYVIITSVIFAAPMITHVIPGFVVFIWLMGPALAISCLIEFYLRNSITVHSHAVVIARLATRVIVLFVAAAVMSLSYNYSTSFIWGEDGYLATGSFNRGSYWEIVVNDFNSRSFRCTWDHIVYAVSNFVQMGFFFL